MAFGVDTLGALSEKLKQLVEETQSLYESFIDANLLYKQNKIGDKEFFSRIGQYLVAASALNFLAVRVILEIKSAIDKGTFLKSQTGGSISASQTEFGIGGFVGTGGTAGIGGSLGPGASNEANLTKRSSSSQSYLLPSPQEPTFKPVDSEIDRLGRRHQQGARALTRSCIVCGASIPKQAKFCSKCGRSQ